MESSWIRKTRTKEEAIQYCVKRWNEEALRYPHAMRQYVPLKLYVQRNWKYAMVYHIPNPEIKLH